MKFPHAVAEGFPYSTRARFQQQFGGADRNPLHLLWRRTQEQENRALSGWRDHNDARRRMIHCKDTYSILGEGEDLALGIVESAVWLQTVSPHDETSEYLQQLSNSLQNAQWERQHSFGHSRVYQKDDMALCAEIKYQDTHDIITGRKFPKNYTIFEVSLYGNGSFTKEERDYPWGVLEFGIRKPDVRGNPEYVTDLRLLERYFPMQVEVGSGPSIEAGVPPLHRFHDLYKVADSKTRQFIFGPQQDTFLNDFIRSPQQFYKDSASLYAKALAAEPTPFYKLLKMLHEQSTVVGDVITNNVDGLCGLVGLPEKNVRTYTREEIVTPQFPFHPDARSLLIVGSHADRRKIARAAREKDLKIIHVDPEGFVDEKGVFHPYPLEGPQDQDILVPFTAQQFVRKWVETFQR